MPETSPQDRGETAVNATSIRRITERLRAAREGLAQRPGEEVLRLLEGLIDRWLEPQAEWRLRAEAVLADTTGFSPAMIRAGLPLLLEPYRGDAIRHLLARELGGLDRVDRRDAGAPALIAHVLPGNIPALGAGAACLSLAVKAAALIKPASGDRWFPGLFVRSIAEIDPDLGRCVAACYWAGGAAEVEREAFGAADVVEVSGSDETVAHLRPRVRGRLIAHGSRISVAFLGHEAVTYAGALTATARSLAEDIALWDQRGCLSPQVVFVETSSRRTLDKVAGELGAALTVLARELPPRPLTLEEQTAVLRFRQQQEWGAGAGGKPTLLTGEGFTWAVVIEDDPSLEPTCLHRTVRLQPVARLSQIGRVVSAKRRWLEAAGIAVDPKRRGEASAALARAGFHRVCRVGRMQRPDLAWSPGGQPRVAGWFA